MIDIKQIYKWWSVFRQGDECVEVRIIGRKQFSGYYKNVEKLISDIHEFEDDPTEQIYFSLNVIKEDCYCRLQKEHLVMSPQSTTSDNDIVGRRFVLVDLDPKRASGVSSSDEELEYAHQKALDIYKFLMDNGFNPPVVAISGNGYHLQIPCRLRVCDETDALVKRFLSALAMLFSDEHVDVDEKVFNRSRICKLYGTTAKKGANAPERPWRLSRIIRCPEDVKPNDIEYFKKVASLFPDAKVEPSEENNFGRGKFDIKDFFQRHDIKYKEEHVAGGTKYILDHCAFNEDHKGKDAMVFQRNDGALAYVCLHNSCAHYGWRDFRMKFEPDAYEKKDYREFQFKQRYYSQIVPAPFVPVGESEDKGKKWLTMKDIKRVKESDAIAIPTGYSYLDQKIKGLLLGEVTLLSGTNGSGKSSWLNNVINNVIQRNFKVACFSGELSDSNMKKWLMQAAAGKSYLYKAGDHEYAYEIEDRVYQKIEDWYDDKFFLYNNNYGNRFEQLQADMEEIIREKGVSLLICDNLMALAIDGVGGDKYERQKAFILAVVAMARKYNVHVVVVAHPRKEANNSLLRKESISGSGDLTNAVQNCFIIHRVGEDFKRRASEFFGAEKVETYMQYDNVIEVCKNRSYGVVDYLVGMHYEVESKRFKNFKSEHIVYGWQDSPAQQTITYDTSSVDGGEKLPFYGGYDDAPF